MKPIKRIEIITEAFEIKELKRIFHRLGIAGYTILPTLGGQGDRGQRSSDGVSPGLESVYVLLACEETLVKPLVEAVRPLLHRFGGVCLVSDAQWLVHNPEQKT